MFFNVTNLFVPRLLVFFFTFLFILQPQLVAATDENVSPPQDNLASLTTEELTIYQEGPISTAGWIGGGLVGTFIGLGIGHAIYGKYQEKGWIFTVGEIGSLTLMVVGAVAVMDDVYTGQQDVGSDSGLLLLGAMGFYGFRIWEAIDVWTRPSGHNDRYDAIKQKVGIQAKPPVSFYLSPMAWRLPNKRNYAFGPQLSLLF